ncbi:MAG TPA: serine/threonine-protein kinase [Fimbriiglobus sp.]|jgi:serine/threonine-protein kinase|nr:serine/threonine-protein kinase [Fimbriiglobus sp.]
MVARLDPCNPDALRLLLADRLPPVAVGELESHLQHCATCRRSLDGMVGGESWWSAVRDNLSGTLGPDGYFGDGRPVDDSLDFLAPSEDPSSLGRIGSYEVKGVLGRGGNGVVLKALDPGLNRYVAVKVIATVLAGSAAAKKRFVREAQAAAAVVHEHVIAVFAIEEASGLPYLVMEYVMGRSLQDRLDRQGPLELKEMLRIGHQTAAGLAAAHAQGLVHRDIKPANILLENGVERVKITDFGLARAVADATLTQSGVITGTPHYMAPEQARGDAVDHRADLFSLGSTLHAMCTGHPPFRADTPLAVLRRVTDESPRPVRQDNPDLPGWLEVIVARLMAKDPAERFQSAAEVALLFERCLAHVQQPLTAPLPAIPGQGLWEQLRAKAVAVPRNILGNIGVRPYHRGKLKRFAANAVAAVAASVVIGAGVAVVTLNRDPVVQTREAEVPEGKRRVLVDEGTTLMMASKPATGPANQSAKWPFDADDNWLWEDAVTKWRNRQKPEAIAVRILEVRDEAAQAELKLTAPRAGQKADPIDAALQRAAERVRALDRELHPIPVLRVEVHDHTETKSQSLPRTVK